MNNNPNFVILHCAASKDSIENNYSVEAVTKDHKARGFKTIGYHFYITRDGVIHIGRPVNMIGAHCKKNNKGSIGVCYEGSYLPTLKQVNSLINLYRQILQIHGIDIDDWHGHNQYSNKDCPGFLISDFKDIIAKM